MPQPQAADDEPRLKGLLYPRTPTGVGTILPDPPWHYSGEMLTVEYRTDPARVAELLPPGIDPANDDEDPGAVAVIWADWQSCSDGGAELIDPVRAQYKEVFVVIRCRFRGELWSRAAYIWVDKDFAMARGHLQGYPKKMSEIWMTRPVAYGKAGPRLEVGGRFGGSLSTWGRRVVDVDFTVTGVGVDDSPGFVNGHAMLHSRQVPALEMDGRDSLDELVTMRGHDVELGPVLSGEAALTIHDNPTEELSRLPIREPIGAWYRQVGMSMGPGTTVAAAPNPMAAAADHHEGDRP